MTEPRPIPPELARELANQFAALRYDLMMVAWLHAELAYQHTELKREHENFVAYAETMSARFLNPGMTRPALPNRAMVRPPARAPVRQTIPVRPQINPALDPVKLQHQKMVRERAVRINQIRAAKEAAQTEGS